MGADLALSKQLYKYLVNLPLVPKHPQSCSKHAGAAVQVPGDLLLVPKQSQSFSKHGEAARYLATSPIFLSNL